MSESKSSETQQLPAVSLTGAIGFFAGVFMVYSGFTMTTESSIHQIYQILNIGGGLQLVVLGGIAQHTKENKKS